MVLAWYEKVVDVNDYLLFDKRFFPLTQKRDHPPHFHKGIEVALCLSGESEVFINGEVYPFTTGTVCFVNSLEVHKYRFAQGAERYVVVISPDCLSSVGWDMSTAFLPITTDTLIFSELKTFLDIAYNNWDKEDKMMKNGFIGMFLALLKNLMPVRASNERGKDTERLIGILRYISSNSDKPLTVEAVAAHFGYSPNYFSSIFKRMTNVTFREYLNFCRVASYRRLRERNDRISVIEAAEQCGFGSVKSLYRACKRSKDMPTFYGHK